MRLDKIIMSNSHESYKNYTTQVVEVTVSGTIPSGGKEFTTTVSLDRDRTRCDVYYVNSESPTAKLLANSSPVLYVFSEAPATTQRGYAVLEYTGQSLKVGVYVTNTSGGNESSTTQTLTFYVVQYQAPITAL
jgi:hypothetical protein